MTVLQRAGYYLGGFALGLIVLSFFLSGKKASCSYGPNARVIKNISGKHFNYGEVGLDSTQVLSILRSGDVDFSKSNTELDSCKTYWVDGYYNEAEHSLLIQNCDSIATILKSSL